MPKFSAHLGYLFPNVPFLQRHKLAKAAGFQAVEGGIPDNISIQEITKVVKEAGVYQHHFDDFRGDLSKGEFGFAALPGQEEKFKEYLLKSLEYAKALNSKVIHVAAGYVTEPITVKHHDTYVKNLRESLPLFEKAGIVAVLEPITKNTRPLYYMRSIQRALSVIRAINSPYLKLELDIFHAQQIQGDLTTLIRDSIDDIGHIQVAQVPSRNEPDTPGEIDYKYVFDLIDHVGYKGYVGLEYHPVGDTVEGLKWIKKWGYSF
ncbi:putative hydroxypyruvate isomerase [Agrilus planipennis]|uniref:Putative hydroxypyruvate isomerase n=1 Tax=Agrilus planipennis TaxID=224129 RepID=A0A1W4XH01_AGRPL|nr:putative hydroxypyruvate isomerase [Agrilus planipennis]